MAEATTKKRVSRPSQPITRHPLFPAIVALWFATLVGMGSFVLRTSLLENFVLATHIDTLVPAAAPPLGTTARLLLAALFGLIGGTIGWVLAWRIANPKQVAAPPVFNFADLEADMPSMAPVKPASAEPELPMLAPEVETPAPVLDPASLAVETEVAKVEAAAEEAPLPPTEVVIEHEEPEQEVIAPPVPTAAERIASADLAALSHVELIERLAIALRKREEWRDAAPAPVVEVANPVVQFPDLADRNSARLAKVAAPVRPAPHETERALRDALAQLQRMSGNA